MLIAGIDEAGRGPVLGPMVLCVACIEKKDEEKLIDLGVKDSKLLQPKERERLEKEIKKIAKEYRLASIEARELDKLMGRHSLNEIEAMSIGKLLNALKEKPEIVFIDSPDVIEKNFAERIKKYLSYGTVLRTEHKADLHHVVCSAASILAKVHRDNEIKKLSKEFGEIGSGYASDERTIKFLKAYLDRHGKLPEICRAKWLTAQKALDEKFQTKLFK